MSEFLDKIGYDKKKKDISGGKGQYSKNYIMADQIKVSLSLTKKTGLTYKPPFLYRYIIYIEARDKEDDTVLRKTDYKYLSLKDASKMFDLHCEDIMRRTGSKVVEDIKREDE